MGLVTSHRCHQLNPGSQGSMHLVKKSMEQIYQIWLDDLDDLFFPPNFGFHWVFQ